MTAILRDIAPFIENINQGIDDFSIDRSYLTEMDHVCYRVETTDRYIDLKRQLARSLKPLAESYIGGRPITTFEFEQPIDEGGWRISYLELPAPKEGAPYTEGLEHAEFVVLGGNLERFDAAHPHLKHQFYRDGMSKPFNPELSLRDTSRHLSVKFHRLPLGEVVRIEQLDVASDVVQGNHITL